MNKHKFYEFKNVAENEYSLYVYGEIVSEKVPDFWTGEKSENEVDISDFKHALADIPNGAKLNMYVNSVGGSVFATSAMVSLLQRAKARGVLIDAYIDGLSASCASWLVMVADNINIYIPKSSVVIENDKRYVKPNKYLNSDNKSDCFTFKAGDIIVKGITDFEIDTGDKTKNIKALEKSEDDVITIFTVVDYDFGSENMKHWKIGGK